MTNIYILIMAATLDFLIGDPWGWPHPVRVMGWVISQWCDFVQKYCHNSITQRLAGVILAIVLIIGSGTFAWLIVQLALKIHPIAGMVLETVILASCFAFKSLRDAAVAVLQPIKAEKLDVSRSVLRNYVGRDTENLNSAEILRAILETVTENATDGVMAPLFYAILGAFVPSIGSAAFALAYKASSTLDSMVGYKSPPYTYLGWFSAKTEDYLTWIPCRLTVITLALISLKPKHVWRLCRRDASLDPSPNSGWSECAYAAILGVQMGGTNWYQGVAKTKPKLGDSITPITEKTIYRALQLTRYCFLLWLGVAVTLLLITTNR